MISGGREQNGDWLGSEAHVPVPALRMLLAWSSGKDSAAALHRLRQGADGHVVALLTTLTEGYGRISMHGVREDLLDAQARQIGLPLVKVWIPQDCDQDTYEARMAETLVRCREQHDVTAVAFGDIFLEDLRRQREEKLASAGMGAVFPLWKVDTARQAGEFIAAGFRAIVTCVDTTMLDGSFAGRAYDASFLADLPAGVDPCGENGEFHSFVHDGPIFRQPVHCCAGEVVLRDERFAFRDVTAAPEEVRQTP